MCLLLQCGGLLRRRLPHAAHLFKFTQSRLSRRFDLGQRFLEVVRFVLSYPEITVGNVTARAGQLDIQSAERVVLCQQCHHTSTLRHRADDFGVADLAEESLRGLCLADISRQIRRAPDLHDVVLPGLRIAIKEDQFACRKQRVAMTWLWRRDALRDEIVAEQQIRSALEMAENKQCVLAIRSGDALLETHRR